MAGEAVHRDLQLTTPLTKGPDVEALQQALNKLARRFPRVAPFQLVEDGKLGEETLLAAVRVARITGLPRARLLEIERKHLISQTVQRQLRHPNRRSDAQKRRGDERRKRIRKQLDKRPSLQGVRIKVSAGKPHWGGSGDVLEQFVEPFLLQRGLPLGSGKRTPAEQEATGTPSNPASKISAHLTTQTTAAARDFPTVEGEEGARALAKSMGFASWQPNSHDSFNFSVGGHSFRGQILWGAGIAHGDHVHVGVRTT